MPDEYHVNKMTRGAVSKKKTTRRSKRRRKTRRKEQEQEQEEQEQEEEEEQEQEEEGRRAAPTCRSCARRPWENGTFFEFSLCLSRACLGKMLIFIYKWLKKCRFLTAVRRLPRPHRA
eukprot:COSAG06_NODE_3548_length_5199_cov_166.747059_4_plen_118_part_00